jgi:hypothetical protein
LSSTRLFRIGGKMKLPIVQPTYPTNTIQSFPSLVENQASTMQAAFDKGTLDGKEYQVTLTADLNGNDGSKKIGHDSPNISSDNVSDAIEEVYAAIASTVLGEIPDNSITNAKLAIDAKVGSLATLNTTEKANVVGAINEINAYAVGLPNKVNTIETDLNIVRTAKTTTGSNVALSVDTDGTFDLTRNGNILTIIPNVANTGTITINVDGQGAIGIRKANDAGTLVVLEAGDIKQNVPTQLVRDTVNNFFVYAPRGGSNLKSGQKGTVQFPSNTTTFNVAITNVDVNKSILKFTVRSISGSLTPSALSVVGMIFNGTTLKFDVRSGSSSSNLVISWEVLEFNNVKSLQKGNFTGASSSITINQINTQKSSIQHSKTVDSTTTTEYRSLLSTSSIDTTTGITLSSSESGVWHWQVIEFN